MISTRGKIFLFRHLVTALSFSFILIQTGCTNKKSTSTEAPDPSQQEAPVDPNQTQYTDPLTTGSDNLFTTTTSADPVANTTVTTAPSTASSSLTQPSIQCLTSGGFSANPFSDILQPSCFDGSSNYGWNDSDFLYGQAISQLSYLSLILERVNQYADQVCVAGSEQNDIPEQAFQAAMMALTRSFRQVNRDQMRDARWAPQIHESFNYRDYLLKQLLDELAQN